MNTVTTAAKAGYTRVAVFAGPPGSLKTTRALNLAAKLSAAGKSVIIDDVSGNTLSTEVWAK